MLYFLLQKDNPGANVSYENIKLRQLHPAQRQKRQERKAICPLSFDTIPASRSSSSLIMTIKPETSLPHIEDASFSMDLELQPNPCYCPQLFSLEGKNTHFFYSVYNKN